MPEAAACDQLLRGPPLESNGAPTLASQRTECERLTSLPDEIFWRANSSFALAGREPPLLTRGLAAATDTFEHALPSDSSPPGGTELYIKQEAMM
jgi:hypothetical protein